MTEIDLQIPPRIIQEITPEPKGTVRVDACLVSDAYFGSEKRNLPGNRSTIAVRRTVRRTPRFALDQWPPPLRTPPNRPRSRTRLFPRGKQDALTALTSPDEAVAREALGYLFNGSRATLDRYLQHSCRVKDPQVRADLAQSSFLKLWSARGTFQNLGESAWHGWLHLTASRCYVDYLRSAGRLASEEEFDLNEIPSEERSIVDAVLTAVASDELFRIADILFLELDPSLSPRMHSRHLLAAQLFYVDGEPWESVVRLLGPQPAGEATLTREELNRWLAQPGVLRQLAFQTLFYGNDRLTAHLLRWPGMSTDERAEALDALLRDGLVANAGEVCAATDKSLTWAEALVVLWRFRHAMLVDQIRARSDHRLNDEQLAALLDRCVSDFPFAGKMRELVAKIVPDASADATTALFGATGLWQRLALEYRFREDLPHRDILERVGPASDVVGYDLTPGMLNVWLSNGRLVRRLGQKFKELHFEFEWDA